MNEKKRGLDIATIFFIAAIAYAVLPELNAQQPEEICHGKELITSQT